MSDSEPTNSDYRIAVRSYQLIKTGITDPLVHNEIVFLEGDKPLVAFNGDPYSRETGKINFPSFSGMDTLRVRAFDGESLAEFVKRSNAGEILPLVAEKNLFQGTLLQMLSHLEAAVTAAEYINKQNIDYVIARPGTPAQNSNSVASSLAHAMGFDYAPSAMGVWAIGHGRQLTPENLPSQIAPQAPPDNALLKQLAQRLNQLDETAVGQQVQQDPNPYKNLGVIGYEEVIQTGRLFIPMELRVPATEPSLPSLITTNPIYSRHNP